MDELGAPSGWNPRRPRDFRGPFKWKSEDARQLHWDPLRYGYGNPLLQLAARGGGTRATEDAVLLGLRWLARHQAPWGSFGVQSFTDVCETPCLPNPGRAEHRTAVTALALYAFVGRKYTHRSNDTYDGIRFGDVIRKGLAWLLSNQDPDGAIGPRTHAKWMYGHAIATLVITEIYNLTGLHHLREPARLAVDWLLSSQSPDGLWGYVSWNRDSRTSLSGWVVLALQSAESVGFRIPLATFESIDAWLERADWDGEARSVTEGLLEDDPRPGTSTAVAAVIHMFAARSKGEPVIVRWMKGVQGRLETEEDFTSDLYEAFWGSWALFRYDGPSGPKWKGPGALMREALLPAQNEKDAGCRRGSWEPVGRWGSEGGRVYSTAMGVLTFEVYYRFPQGFYFIRQRRK